MEQDHYSILGVTPKAERAEIRAAYRALTRIYHPDADRSSEAADRARQINAAYSVLNNPERRTSYDDSLAEHRRIRFEPVAAQAVLGPRRFPYAAAVAIFIAVLAAGMIAFAVSPSMTGLSAADTSTINDRPPPPLPTTARRVHSGKVALPDLCTDNRAAGLIKQALFQRASRSGSADRALLARAEPLASALVESAHSEDVGCAGWLSLDIPPGVAVDGDRISLLPRSPLPSFAWKTEPFSFRPCPGRTMWFALSRRWNRNLAQRVHSTPQSLNQSRHWLRLVRRPRIPRQSGKLPRCRHGRRSAPSTTDRARRIQAARIG